VKVQNSARFLGRAVAAGTWRWRLRHREILVQYSAVRSELIDHALFDACIGIDSAVAQKWPVRTLFVNASPIYVGGHNFFAIDGTFRKDFAVRSGHKALTPEFNAIPTDGRFVADATIPIADLAARLGKELPSDGDFESLGGLITHRAGRVPAVGSIIRINDIKLTVREADETRVVKVEIAPADPEPPRPEVLSQTGE